MTGPVWLNGRILPAEEARLSVDDRGFLLGDGLFETIRIRRGAALRLDAHLARLQGGCAAFGIAPPQVDWRQAISALQSAQEQPAEDAVLRITVSRGAGGRGLIPTAPMQPTVLLGLGPLPPRRPPVRAMICSLTRRYSGSLSARWKTTGYLDQIAARREAEAAGCDEAMLLNERGDLACASAANLFARIDGRWHTPPIADGALPGTARGCLIPALAARETSLNPQMTAAAETLILTNALGCTAVAQLGEHSFQMKPASAYVDEIHRILDLS